MIRRQAMPVPPVSAHLRIEDNHRFGEPRATNYAPNRKHNGLDYYVNKGAQVRASRDGRVVLVGEIAPNERIVSVVIKGKKKKVKRFSGAYGKVIVIYHGQNLETLKHTYTLYSHLVDFATKKGRDVYEGQLIGFVGNSGTKAGFDKKEKGFKLHFEVLESKSELRNWDMTVKTDYGIQKQTFRVNPESFLKAKGKLFVSDYKDGNSIIHLKDGSTLTFSGSEYLHRDSRGMVLHRVKSGERPYSPNAVAHEIFEYLNWVAENKDIDDFFNATMPLTSGNPNLDFRVILASLVAQLVVHDIRKLMEYPWNPPHKDGPIEDCPRHREGGYNRDTTDDFNLEEYDFLN